MTDERLYKVEKVYKFRLEQDLEFEIYCPKITMLGYRIFEQEWATIIVTHKRVKFRVKAGYAWDGCSPKFKIGNRIFGIWDGFYNAKTLRPDCYLGSLAHDILYQYMGIHCLSRKQCDYVLYRGLLESRFIFRWLYWAVVRVFGRVAIKVGTPVPK